jgi:predicted TIM-barrel fold metal-dependent hydrolase
VPQLTLFRTLELPDDVQAKIFRDNARTLLGLT